MIPFGSNYIYQLAADRAMELQEEMSDESLPLDDRWMRKYMKMDTLAWFSGAIPWERVCRTVDQARAEVEESEIE